MRRRSIAALVALLLGSLPAMGQVTNVVFYDPFEDGGRTDGTDAYDLNWWRANQFLTMSIVSDGFAGGGSTSALDVDLGGGDAFKRIYANFTTTSLGENFGDSLVLSFGFRALTTGWNNANLFRFGLYNANGTVTNADIGDTSWSVVETNDFGYNARLPFGTAAAASIYKEPAGDNALGGTTAGTVITNGGGAFFSITDTNLHTVAFSLTRTNTGVFLTLAVDGVVKQTGFDGSGLYTNFNAVYFGTGGQNNFDYRLDNVQLDTVAIPEPGTWLLAGLGLLVLGIGRRRTATRAG